MGDMDQLLLKAAANGDATAAQVALSSGASKDATTAFGFTALHVAATKGHLAVVRLLIDAGADVDRRDHHGISPLHQAFDWPEVMEALLDAGADVDGTTFQGVTPLMSAAVFGDMESVRLLLARGADPTRREDVRNATAAECADEKGNDEIASFLYGLDGS